MKPLVWVTRPDGQNATTVSKLENMGFEPLLAPLLTVQQLPLPALKEDKFDAIVLTSANAVVALQKWASDRPELFALPVVTTGRSTAEAARKAGFENTFPIQGPAPAAFRAVPQALGKRASRLLYPCALNTAHDALELAEQNGLEVTALPVYATHTVENLPDAAQSLWSGGKIAAVLLYSPRTARAFAYVAQTTPEKLPVLGCLSKAIAEALPDHWQTNAVWPELPSEDLILKLLAAKFD